VLVAAFAPFVPHGGLRALYDQTLGYQAGRASPFSIWGQHAGLADVWTAAKVLVVALALAVAFVPRRKTPVQVAALGAAVLIGLQLAVAHWFYLYIVWFTPFVLVALFALYRGDQEPAVGVTTAAEEELPAAVAVA
jgi:tetrahydromethanopterin S-methyltransferase subunit D